MLRNLMTVQEVHHQRNKRYASSLSDLGGVAVPDGVTVTLIAPTASAYWLIAEVKGSRAICVVGIGNVVPFGFVEACG
jgi:hypothetical protein